MPTAYIYRGTFQVRAGETLRYVEVAADGTIGPEVAKTYAELAGVGSLPVPAVSLSPVVSAPSLSGVQIGAMAGASVSLEPVVSPAAVSGVQVGSMGAAAVSLRPTVSVGSVTGVRVGSIGAAAVSLRPAVAVGILTGVEVASAPTQPVISATGGDTTVTITKTSGGTGTPPITYALKWRLAVASGGDGVWSAYSDITLDGQNRYVKTGLTNGNTYDFMLRATNAQGSTESAEVSAAATLAITENFENTNLAWPYAGTAGSWTRSGANVLVQQGAGALRDTGQGGLIISGDEDGGVAANGTASITLTFASSGTLAIRLAAVAPGTNTFTVKRAGGSVTVLTASSPSTAWTTYSGTFPAGTHTFTFNNSTPEYAGVALDNITWTPT